MNTTDEETPMDDNTVEITPDQAAHVLHHFGHGGYPAGSFTTVLIEAISKADPLNRMRLALGFPGYVRAVHLVQSTPDGVDKVKEAMA